ncbi:MAG: type II toxin-antitoxin system RelE/ParE family toxin [Candidatus Neomarinimicrobiota bacterium]
MAGYELLIKPSAVKEIELIDGKRVRRRVVQRIRELAEDPRPKGCEKLARQECYRLRQGPYRIVYAVDDEQHTVLIVKVGHRKEVYRK